MNKDNLKGAYVVSYKDKEGNRVTDFIKKDEHVYKYIDSLVFDYDEAMDLTKKKFSCYNDVFITKFMCYANVKFTSDH